jgi:hypothetical protein
LVLRDVTEPFLTSMEQGQLQIAPRSGDMALSHRRAKDDLTGRLTPPLPGEIHSGHASLAQLATVRLPQIKWYLPELVLPRMAELDFRVPAPAPERLGELIPATGAPQRCIRHPPLTK